MTNRPVSRKLRAVLLPEHLGAALQKYVQNFRAKPAFSTVMVMALEHFLSDVKALPEDCEPYDPAGQIKRGPLSGPKAELRRTVLRLRSDVEDMQLSSDETTKTRRMLASDEVERVP